MPTKVPARKTKTTARKPVKKTVRKRAKKVTWNDIEAGFERLQKLHEETEKTLKKSQDEAWAAIREVQQSVKEAHDNDFDFNKLKDETWAAIRENQRTAKEMQKNIGGLNNTLGSMVERMMTPDLPRKFKPLGFTFDKISIIKWSIEGCIYCEIDGLLENGTQAMAVEVKTTLEIEDINEHLKRMEKIRKYADEHGDKREFLCTMAAMIIKPKPKEYALKQGLFVIEPRGEDFKVIKPSVEPRVW